MQKVCEGFVFSVSNNYLNSFFDNDHQGEMSERFNEAVLKTVEGNTSGGSNPSLSAFARRSQNEVLSEGGPFQVSKSLHHNGLRRTKSAFRI